MRCYASCCESYCKRFSQKFDWPSSTKMFFSCVCRLWSKQHCNILVFVLFFYLYTSQSSTALWSVASAGGLSASQLVFTCCFLPRIHQNRLKCSSFLYNSIHFIGFRTRLNLFAKEVKNLTTSEWHLLPPPYVSNKKYNKYRYITKYKHIKLKKYNL